MLVAEGNSANKGSKVDVSESVCSGHFKKSHAPRTEGSILCLLEELVKAEQTMGYNKDGCVNNMTKIIESQGASLDGEVVTMGDSNEVRYKSDRFCSVFNVQGTDVFNSFIANTGLEEVPLGESSFTWCHKSATKMSKLDRFLISENLLITCPNISATTLDRYLSDHHTWSEAPGDDSNDMRSMMRKLKYLKVKIREWNNGNRNNTKRAIEKYKEELEALDAAIDKGNGSDDIVNKRMEVIKSMHHIGKIQAMDMAQKAKIKCSTEGDENSQFFHRVLNKKRNQLNICGIMVDGVWTEKPNTVKHEFLQHFRRRFDKPTVSRAYVNMSYPKSITIDQQIDLERDVYKEELTRAVWDYGTDKSPGPDGFTFGFYRHFWPIIENDVFEAVKHFFTYADIPKGCNSSFIALIPKISNANLVKDFRPISLIGKDEKVKYAASKLGSNKATWVKWNSVLASKEKGGLGVSSLYALNRGLMLKWVWRFYSQKTSLWAGVIKAVYGDDGKVGKVTNAGIRSCWTNIVNEISVLKNQGINVFDFMRLKLGNGDTTAFWKDNWIGGNVLKDLYPRIYDLETCKSVTVSKELTDSSLDNSFRRKTRDGVEQVQYNDLSDLVHAVTLMSLSDRWAWSLESSGEFFVASVRKVIDEKWLSNVTTVTRWIKCVPIKVNILAWKIKIDALPTKLNISRQGIDIDSILCPICDCGVESFSHLFFSCSLARQVARKISLWWDVTYVDVNSYVE
nr:RNA-directed DNA polymerase, eukaryota, reverse transcriptase zinc-binding domain protein [Tanacetum cinerariifolium]